LKIDQSFVRGMLEDPEDLAILVGVLGLAEAFQRKVIAEGVETLDHGERLLDLGCEGAQGYAIARPMPVDKIVRWVATWQVPNSWAFRPVRRKGDLSSFMHEASQRASKKTKSKR
jgi:EAL domain-containing protein (putative c-di-GMP-specific phosphodiesterase class I)